MVTLDELRPHPENANTHSPEQISRLAKILKYQGWRKPIVVSKLSGYIVSGHGRLQASRIAGFEKVPIDEQDYESEEQEFADLIADNRIAELSDWNTIKLNDQLASLKPKLSDLELSGFDEIDLGNIAESLFNPSFEPVSASGQVTGDQVNAVNNALSGDYEGNSKAGSLRSITCPSCGDDFSININEIPRPPSS